MARILVVEDEAMIAMMLADWIVELGHEALGPARTVEQALALIETERPGTAILDVLLMGERSDPVADLLSTRDIPFAFATGADAGSISRRFADSPLLMKPYDFEKLRGVVETLCR